MKKYSVLLIVMLAILCSCHHFLGRMVRGNGIVKTDERNISPFKDLEVHGGIDVVIVQGELKPIQIRGDENLFNYIEVRQDGDRLIVGERDGFNLSPTDKMEIRVTAPAFQHIALAGAGNISAESKISATEELELGLSGAGNINMEVDAPKLSANISGVGSLYLRGQTREVVVDLSGAGSAHCYDLMAENTRVDVSGVGSAEVFASVKLDAQVSGVGSVRYKGNAPEVNQHVSGVGSINKVQ